MASDDSTPEPVASPGTDGHELREFLAQDRAELEAEYRRIFRRASEDPGTAGDEGEENWAKLLGNWLPSSYQIATKGRIVFPDGSMSPQVDVVVLRSSYPQRLLTKKVYMSSGVLAAFECKTTLRSQHIREAVETAAFIKERSPGEQGTPKGELRSTIVFGLLAHSHAWQRPESKPIDNIDAELAGAITRLSKPSVYIDTLCVSDLATWTLSHFVVCPWHYDQAARNAFELNGYPPGGGIGSQYTRFTREVFEANVTPLDPVAVLIAELLYWFGWDDRDVRPMAEYFQLVGLSSAGTGPAFVHSLDAFGPTVRAILQNRPPSQGSDSAWDEWRIRI